MTEKNVMNLLKSSKRVEIVSLHLVQTNASRIGLPLRVKLTHCVHTVLTRKNSNNTSFLTSVNFDLRLTKAKLSDADQNSV